ncbi:hypothetical protein BGZ50_004886 [Haplosporangium sp. Z 11]|nr:hypothetical protein BGZ50_004886 [Haplosporangium sp. Z 11]
MTDIVVYEDSPLALYLQDIQGEQHTTDLQHATVPVHEPRPQPESITLRLAHNAVGMLTHLVEYISHTFSPSASDSDDTEFEERFKYFICTSPFLNKTVTLHSHERGRRMDTPITIEYTSRFSIGRFGYVLGFGTVATLIARSVLARTRIGRYPLMRPLLGRSAAVSVAVASSAWMLRILQRRNTQSTQNQALRSLQVLVNQCQTLDAKVNRAIMVIQEIELVSRGYRLSTPLAPISRIEQASKTRRCNMVRAQLVAALVKSAALFQKSTETLQSHIDPKRLSTLLDMYNITPTPRPNSPIEHDRESHRNSTYTAYTANSVNDNDQSTVIASPTSDTRSPQLPSTFAHHARQRSASKRRSRTLTGGSSRHSRTNSFQDPSTHHAEHQRRSFDRRPVRRHHTSWSASEGEDSDPGSIYPTISPRSSTYSNPEASPTMTATPEMTSLERLRKSFQRMHGHRREFLCELLSIRRRSRKGRQGLNALKDYDRNWTVVRDVLQEGVAGIESVVKELGKVLDTELYTLPRIDTHGNNNNNNNNRDGDSIAEDALLRPFVNRLAHLEQHVRGVQAKLYICNEDIKETIREDPVDVEKRRLLEMQFDSISQDLSMMAAEWQLGKNALAQVFDPSLSKSKAQDHDLPLLDEHEEQGYGQEYREGQEMEPITDSMEHMEDHQRLMALAAKREETWEASTESGSTDFSLSGRTTFMGPDGAKMTRSERIQHQKMLREQEQIKKERTHDSSRMVHELKNVLGRRRHLRENDDDDTPTTPAPTGSFHSITTELSTLPKSSFLDQEMSASPVPTERISSFSLNVPDYTRDMASFIAAMEPTPREYMEESYIEISGMGEAEEEEEDQGVDQEHSQEAAEQHLYTKHPALPTATLPKRGLVLSKLGFGAYRTNSAQSQHRDALVKAIQAGVNVIDTSTHFGHGASETFIGDVLADMFAQDIIKREQVVVVSKAGFVLPQTPSFPFETLGNVPSYAKISESSYHSIHPTFLRAQITESLERLKLNKLDIFMLNNPERMLGYKHLPGGYGKTKLYKEIAETFAYLDQEVKEGRIGGYGICSNALHIPTTEDHLSLKAIAKTRLDFGWKLENFVAIQVPLNLFERDAVVDVFPSKSLAREAKELGLFVFTNRPLNAIAAGQIVTLENKGQHNQKSAMLLDTLDSSFTSLAEMELDIKDLIEEESIAMKFVWSEVLSENLSRLSTNYYAAKHFLEREVLPAIDRDLEILKNSINDQQDQEEKSTILSWIDRYRKDAKTLTADIAAFCQLDSDKRNDELNLVLGLICRDFVSDVGPNKVEDGLMIGSALSTKSIQFCIAQENIGCTLVGMRTPQYVQDALLAAEASRRLKKHDLELISQCPLLLATTE